MKNRTVLKVFFSTGAIVATSALVEPIVCYAEETKVVDQTFVDDETATLEEDSFINEVVVDEEVPVVDDESNDPTIEDEFSSEEESFNNELDVNVEKDIQLKAKETTDVSKEEVEETKNIADYITSTTPIYKWYDGNDSWSTSQESPVGIAVDSSLVEGVDYVREYAFTQKRRDNVDDLTEWSNSAIGMSDSGFIYEN
ncbi:MAG: hypothetical protein J6O41_01215, partial [Clostridia bacterium]|nr:hypothetical protein [Clostridia bacterium]